MGGLSFSLVDRARCRFMGDIPAGPKWVVEVPWEADWGEEGGGAPSPAAVELLSTASTLVSSSF